MASRMRLRVSRLLACWGERRRGAGAGGRLVARDLANIQKQNFGSHLGVNYYMRDSCQADRAAVSRGDAGSVVLST